MHCVNESYSINPFSSVEQHKTFMYNGTLTLIILESGAKLYI